MTALQGNALFDTLSSRQVAALANVAFGGHGGGVHLETLVALANRGLIVPSVSEERTGYGKFRYGQWEMPLSVHIDFCGWCASTLDDLPELDDADRSSS